MFPSLPERPVIEPIKDPQLAGSGVRLEMVRLDKVHPLVNGNKWFKLKWNLLEAQRSRSACLLSFGGAYSNHIRAVAAGARLAGMRSIGIIRGEMPEPLNPVLRFARQQGMALHAVSRSDYRRKTDPIFIAELQRQFGEFFLIPEGGSNEAGVKGCEDLMHWLTPVLETKSSGGAGSRPLIAVACGTGATLAGLVRGAGGDRCQARLLGVSVLKGAQFLDRAVRDWTADGPQVDWRINHDYHFGGYARSSAELIEFISAFKNRTGVPLEPVYTGKLLYGLYDLIDKGAIDPFSRVICLHTGGLFDDLR